jgi:trans-aconitate 2-methyltransferase
MKTVWDPDQYLRFSSERERPFFDLLAHVPIDSPSTVVDLGCGPGTTTAALLERWPAAKVIGIDNSEAMIEQAMPLSRSPQLAFELGDIARWEPQPTSIELILSNAALHWVQGHLSLLPRWLAALSPHGVLAFQVPGNFDSPSHVLLRELAASPQWQDELAAVATPVELPSPSEYCVALRKLGARVNVWETTYHHVLSGPHPVLQWVAGTALRPYLSALDEAEAEVFKRAYGRALADAYPPEPSGETLFPFRRVFVVASV